uniref:Protein kinase domain-containing protein n=1 Tax=Macrostomum lignano TaxID=282301 RepID=A0A1I8IVB5_9PLAT
MATEMERKLRAALEAGDSEELQRLCGEVGSNIELEVGGFDKQDYPFEELRNAAGPSRGLQAVHLAAQHQDESWMKLVKEKGGRGCLRIANKDGKTVAHFAAMNRKSNSCLKWLVKELGSDCLTVPDKSGTRPSIWPLSIRASSRWSIESLEWIKRQIGTDCFRLKGDYDRTAFHFAAEKSDNSNLKWLVKELGSDCLTVPDKDGDTAVHLAAQHQGIESLEFLKRTAFHFAAVKSDNSNLKWLVKELGSDCLTVPDKYGDTAVHLAAQHQGIESLEWIKRQIGTDCFRLKGDDDRTAFHFAAQKSDNSNLKWLVKELGSDCLTVPDEYGTRPSIWPLSIRASSRWKQHFTLLLRKSDNSNLKWLVKELGSDCLTVPDKYGNTAVHLAAQHQGIESLEWIKRQIGTDCFRLKTKSDRTAFHFAAKKSDNSNLKWLVKELSSDCLTVPDNSTAVHLAAKHQSIESLEWIKRQIGTDCFRLKARFLKRTAFHFAAVKSDNSNLKWLVKELGSDCLTVPDKDGDTAVHWAAEWQPVDSLQFIFDQIGAEMLSLKNNKGETPADLVDIGRWCTDKSAKRAWISSTQRRLEASRPPAGSSAPTAASAGAKKQLDPSFTDWDFILQDNNKKQLIGRGGFGKVYKALTDRNQTVAVKVLPLSGTGQSGSCREPSRWRSGELRSSSDSRIPTFCSSSSSSRSRMAVHVHIFTELVSGHSLFELMQRQNKPFKESGPEGAILHRDVNSKNVMLSNEGVIKLIDFGLAKEIGKSSGLSTDIGPKGTTLLHGSGAVRHRSPFASTDMWAFGCTVYELTAMQPPDGDRPSESISIRRFRKQNMPRIADGFSAGLKDFYLRCVDYDPRKRADTAELLRHSFLSASS